MADLNGLPAEQHIGRTLREILTPDLADTVEPLLRQVLETGRPQLNYEVHGATLPRAGEQRHWLVNYHPVQAWNGTITGVHGVVQEITERKQAEEALRESQRFLHSILNALSGHIAVLDGSGTILEINEAWRRFAIENQGEGADAGIGINYLQHCEGSLPENGEMPAYARGINDVIAGRRSHFEMEYTCHSPTQQRWFLIRVNRFQGPGPVRVVIVHDDFTERRLAENASREAEERYRNLFNSMDEGFCVIEMLFDAQQQPVDFRSLEVNPAFEMQTGMGDVTGKRVRELIPDLEAYWFEIYGRVALTGKPVRFINEVKVLGQWLDVHAARLGSPENRQVGIIFANVTQRMKADEALRQSEARFRLLFDRGPVAIYSCDTSGTIKEFNPCAVKLWGREPTPQDIDERFCGAARVYCLDGTLLTPAQNPMLAVLKGKILQAHDVEAVIERPDGSRIHVIANIVPLRNSWGEITGAINCFYDITERSRLEQKTQEQAQALAELHQRKDEFLAMLSHELRNPLAPLASAVQLLRLHKNEAPLQQQALGIIERQTGQLKHLVDDLMEISRITSGSVRLRQERVSLGEVVERALETTRPLMLQRRHELAVSLQPEPLWLHADATRLEQVLVNLLTNAAKYTDKGGRIWLSVGPEESAGTGADAAAPMAVVRVRDSGIGIAPELLPRIFDLFTQAERSIDRSQGGLGIGLCLVQRLLQLHGGTVDVRSVLGQGSEFVVRLPLMPAGMQQPSLHVPLPAAAPPAKGCRVLAVDDNVDAVRSLAMLLEMSGHVVEIAYDGPSALTMALAMQPDVMLLDIGLPGLTGYEVAEQVRQQPALRQVVLVARTGYGRAADRQFSKDAGFDYHLVKPADFREVEKILEAVGEQVALPDR
jgi:PAS domain S-box-containing protein